LEIRSRYQDVTGRLHEGTVRNISLGGMYVRTSEPLVKGVMVVMELEVASRETRVDIGGLVVRSDAALGMALEFVDKDNAGIRGIIRGIRRAARKDEINTGIHEQRKDPRLHLSSIDHRMSKKKKREALNGDHVKKEKRRHSRKLLRVEARYQDPESRVLKGVLRNISLSGLYIETTNTLEVHTKVHMSLDATDLGKVIDVSGRVIRSEDKKGMAIEFDDKDNREIRLLLSSLRKLDQASMLALIRSGLGE
jgi:hypothetical protein